MSKGLSDLEGILLAMVATQLKIRGDQLTPGDQALALYEAAELIDTAVQRLEDSRG